MPSNYAHYSFGKQVYQKQPAFIKKIIHDHLDLYLIGLHGPDILFYFAIFSSRYALTVRAINLLTASSFIQGLNFS